jgi:ABC-type cobalamin transport system permease subunit
MLYQMVNEFLRFLGTFGLVILMFWLMGRMLGADFKVSESSFFEVFLDLFNAINGNPLFHKFKIPTG